MFQFSFFRVVAVLALSVCAAKTDAEVLATRVHSWEKSGGVGPGFTVENGGYRWQIYTAPFPISVPISSLTPAARVWNTVRFTAADIGTTFEVNSANYPAFGVATALLTNGTSNTVLMTNELFFVSPNGGQSQGGGIVVSDQFALFSSTPNSPIDLAGYEILAMRYRLDSYSVATTPEPNGGTLFEQRGQVTVTIEGRVPEPAFLSSLVPASFYVLSRKKSRRRS